ncbi:hypothetical protein GE21DRAFT_1199927 [Neurospora crassa]|nr:hypothetical protein GE21DRAFT_1199927 [Neurospora crassa]
MKYVILHARGCAECSRWCCPENEVVEMNNSKLMLMSSQGTCSSLRSYKLTVMVSSKYGNRLKWVHAGGKKTWITVKLGFRFCKSHVLAPQSKLTALMITGFRCGVGAYTTLDKNTANAEDHDFEEFDPK